MNIFEQLNILLTESEDKSKVKESDIPIHPEMETKEQGEMAAAEKILKLFQKLQFGSGDNKESIKDSRPEIPDDMIDPMMKEKPKSLKDKSFEKNKLAGWDEKSEEKIKKEVEVDNRKTDIDDDFDVFVAFETMNNRGKKLSNLEILKNRLMKLLIGFSHLISQPLFRGYLMGKRMGLSVHRNCI